jgi:hypothetical protein
MGNYNGLAKIGSFFPVRLYFGSAPMMLPFTAILFFRVVDNSFDY